MEESLELVSAAAEKVNAFRHRVEQIRILPFPSENPKKLIELHFRIAKRLQVKLNEYYKDLLSATDSDIKHRILGDIKLLVNLVKRLAAELRFIEGAKVERTPWSLVQPVEKLAQKLLPGTRLIVRPQWHYNYGILEVIDTYKKATESFFDIKDKEEVFNGLPENIHILSFPGLERGNVLLHVNFGHEIGHPLVQQYLLKEDQNYLIDIRQEAAEATHETRPIFQILEVEELTKRVSEYRKKALQEILADLISVRLFGLAAVFAIYRISLFSEFFDNISEKSLYPPMRTRLRYCLDAIQWPQYSAALERTVRGLNDFLDVKNAVSSKIAQLQNLVRDKRDEENINKKIATRIAYRSVRKALPSALQFINQRTGDTAWHLNEKTAADVFRLVERLKNKVPPNEFASDKGGMKVGELAAIANAGWFYKLTYLPEIFKVDDPTEYFQEIDIINRLVLRGIEMSDLQREYVVFKGNK